MFYTINSIKFEDILTEGQSCFFYENDTLKDRPFFRDSDVFSDHCWLHLEMYDEIFNLEYVSFEIKLAYDQLGYCLIKDKLFIFLSPNDKIYCYSLSKKKCLDIATSHNFFIHERTNNEFFKQDLIWKFSSSYECFAVQDYLSLSVFNENGIIWQKNNEPTTNFNLKTENNKLIVIQSWDFDSIETTYEIQTGRFLDEITYFDY